MLISAIAITSLPLFAQQEDFSLEGVSVPLRQDISAQLTDAQTYLKQQRWSEAIPALQLLTAAPADAVRAESADLYFGIANSARQLLLDLPEAGREWYHNNYNKEAIALVKQLQLPLDINGLEKIGLNYSGLAAADVAKDILNRAYLDRNYHSLTRPLEPKRKALVADHELLYSWNYIFEDTLPLRYSGHRLSFAHGLVYATNGHDVVALDANNGNELWKFKDPAWTEISGSLNEDMHAAQSEHTLLQPVIYGDVLLVNLHLAQPYGRNDKYRSIDIRHMIPLRRLHAFDAHSGELLWRQQMPSDVSESKLATNITIGSPVISAGRVYVPVYDAGGNVDISLMCFDLYSGKELFKTFLASGSMETNLFGNLLTEVAAPAPVTDGKHVWVVSQFGTVSCVSARTGIIEWTRAYPRTKVVVHQDGRVSQRINHFGNNDIFLSNELLAIAPIDSKSLLVLDASDGKIVTAIPAQDRDDNNIRFLIDFDGTELTTSGSRLQKFNIRKNEIVALSPQLYRYNGYNNENMLSAKLSMHHAWMPYENGVVVAKTNKLNEIRPILEWGDSSGTVESSIQVSDSAVMALTRTGFSSYSSANSHKLVLAQAQLSRDDFQYFLRVHPDSPRVTQAITQRLKSELRENFYLSYLERELAQLASARCDLLLGNNAAALPILKLLMAAVDDNVAWRANVLFSESTGIATQALLSASGRPAMLLSNDVIPATALCAYLANDWQALLVVYLGENNYDNPKLGQWLNQSLNNGNNQQQLEAWLETQLSSSSLSAKTQATLYKIAYKFSSKDFVSHQQLIVQPQESVPDITRVEEPLTEPLPWHWTLLHSFDSDGVMLLFQSQHTLILVKDGEVNYITPFSDGLRLSNLTDNTVKLNNGCAVLSGATCVYFNNDGRYYISNLNLEVSRSASPAAVGSLVAYVTHDDSGTSLALIEPSSGSSVLQQLLSEDIVQRSYLLAIDNRIIYANFSNALSVDLLHQAKPIPMSFDEAESLTGTSAFASRPVLSRGSNADGELLMLILYNKINRHKSIVLEDIQYLNCVQRSFNIEAIADGTLVSFVAEDPAQQRLLLHLLHFDDNGNTLSHHKVQLAMLINAQTEIVILDNQILVGVSNDYYSFPIK
jgi:outer membrane protein assembly factor BamB